MRLGVLTRSRRLNEALGNCLGTGEVYDCCMMNDGGEWRTWRVTVDGGGETWPVLADMVGHRIAELRPGDVLHVISREPTTWCDIAEWCGIAGHDLLMVQARKGAMRYWIKKGGSSMAE